MIFVVLVLFNVPLQQPSLAGWWVGHSHCVEARPACHEEDVLLQFEPGTASAMVLHGFRVSGRDTVDMGDLTCRPAREPAAVLCDIPVGRWHFWVAGDHVEGTLTNLDGTRARQVRAIRRLTER